MVVIPAGHFLMGSSDEDTKRDLSQVPHSNETGALFGLWVTAEGLAKKQMPREHPQHRVDIERNFAIGKYPVTRKEFSLFVERTGFVPDEDYLSTGRYANGHSRVTWTRPGFMQTDLDPVVCMTWNDARAYVHWLNERLGLAKNAGGNDGPYRLPSEAEWEYAARAGTMTAWWWGNDIGNSHANCAECSGVGAVTNQTTPVAYFPPNAFGLHDMLENVFEYAADCWHENYIGAPSDGRPWIDTACRKITFRGGGWESHAWAMRSANRGGWEKDSCIDSNGFRVAKTLQ